MEGDYLQLRTEMPQSEHAQFKPAQPEKIFHIVKVVSGGADILE